MPFRAALIGLTGAGLVVMACGAHAEKQDSGVRLPSIAATQAAVPDNGVPNGYKLNMLIRTTLIALNQANQTGNYSVLRDLGTTQFQSMNTDARLTEIFTALRNRKLDLSPVIFFDPKLVREPRVQPTGLLRLTGFIPTEPERVLFDMGFEKVGDDWRLSAIVIDVQPAPKAAGATASGAAKTKAAPKAKASAKPASAAPAR